MKAIILAGGRGTRLAPYTTVLPKPLMPIGDAAILEVVIRQLAYYGIDDITLAVGYLAELLMAYCGDGSKFGVKITYSCEEIPLGTAGPITLVPNLDETFLVMNGDLLTTINYSEMWQYHQRRGSLVTLATYQRQVKIDLGVIDYDADNFVTNYTEKPTYHYSVSSGIYIFEPEIFNYLDIGKRCDLPELVLRLLNQGEKVSCYSYNGYWLDIGRHDDYQLAIDEFEKNRNRFLPDEA